MRSSHARREDDLDGHLTPRSNASPADAGLLNTLALEHEQLTCLVREAKAAESPELREEALSALAGACRQRSRAAEMVLLPAISEVDIHLVERWKEAHTRVLTNLFTARDRLSYESVRAVEDAIDHMALVVDPQLFLTSAVASGCLFTAELGEQYRCTKESLSAEYRSGVRPVIGEANSSQPGCDWG